MVSITDAEFRRPGFDSRGQKRLGVESPSSIQRERIVLDLFQQTTQNALNNLERALVETKIKEEDCGVEPSQLIREGFTYQTPLAVESVI